MKKRKMHFTVSIIMACMLLFTACGSAAASSNEINAAEYEARIDELQQEIDLLKEQLDQIASQETQAAEDPALSEAASETASHEENLSTIETTPAEESTSTTETVSAENTETTPETAPEEELSASEDGRTQVVVFGDSIWDSTRDETGIAYLVSQYTGADVYNCALGGSTASIKSYISELDLENWESTSLAGMVNVATGKVPAEPLLSGHVAGGVVKNIDFSKTDFFIIAYGLNDYFSGAPISLDDRSSSDPHSYRGALGMAINDLREAYPESQILLITPTYCQFWKEGGGMETDSNLKDYGQGTLTDYSFACQNVSQVFETLCIDAYSKMGITPYTAHEYLEDGVHLNAAGRELYAKAVSSCIKYGTPGHVSGNSLHY